MQRMEIEIQIVEDVIAVLDVDIVEEKGKMIHHSLRWTRCTSELGVIWLTSESDLCRPSYILLYYIPIIYVKIFTSTFKL